MRTVYSSVDSSTEADSSGRTAPVALFVYKRPLHTQRTIQALAANPLANSTDLIAFSDGARTSLDEPLVSEVRGILASVAGFRSVTVVERELNLGLSRSIIQGVTTVCERFGRVIVLEDDMVTSPWFLTYMNDALNLYAEDADVASVHGYCYPVESTLPETFFLRGADCWGWATWSRSWRTFETDGRKLLDALIESELAHEFDLDGAYDFTEMLRRQIAGRNDSWAVRWHASCFLNGFLTLYPGRTLVRNIGNDATGAHCEATDSFESAMTVDPIDVQRIPRVPLNDARLAFSKFLRSTHRRKSNVMFARAARALGSLLEKYRR